MGFFRCFIMVNIMGGMKMCGISLRIICVLIVVLFFVSVGINCFLILII